MAPFDEFDEKRSRDLERLLQVGLALSSEKNRDRLVERILLEAKSLCHADGGTLYLRTEDDQLRFAILRTDSLGLRFGGEDAPDPSHLLPIPLFLGDAKTPNHHNVASYAANLRRSVNIPDIYTAEGFDFSGSRQFDAANQYRSQSILTVPMTAQTGKVIGVLQLLNAQDESGARIAFGPNKQELVEALASQAAVALDNQLLLTAQRRLMEAIIEVLANAIDDKSAYTGGHCRRVPELTEALVRAVYEDPQHGHSPSEMSDEAWYELKIAAWLHDCGKVTTPVHVMDKSTKLETIHDRIHEIETRFSALRVEQELELLKAIAACPERETELRQAALEAADALAGDLAFVQNANRGTEFFRPEDKARLQRIAQKSWRAMDGSRQPLLTEDEVAHLSIARGTLSHEERLIINGHIVQTIRMLESLPFPPELSRVPEYATHHHERMDGQGYPRGVFAGDLPLPARAMAIADVFEALTAADRPYKPAKTLSQTMRIMGEMKRHNHLDPDLLDIFVKSGVYRSYAKRHLPSALIDEVDEAAFLAIEPTPFELPSEPERRARMREFLPEYQSLLRGVDRIAGTGL